VIISGFQQILKKEGLPGMYRGLSPTIVALFPTWAVRNCSSYIFYNGCWQNCSALMQYSFSSLLLSCLVAQV
jgi:hypothetical protein